jgi:hypothetical protein
MTIRSSSRDAGVSSRTLEFKCSKLVTSCPATDSTTGDIPTWVVIDPKMGARDLGSLELIRRIRLPDSRTQILVFSMHDNPAIVTLGVRHKTVVNMSYQLRLKLGARSLPELIRKANEILAGRA